MHVAVDTLGHLLAVLVTPASEVLLQAAQRVAQTGTRDTECIGRLTKAAVPGHGGKGGKFIQRWPAHW